MGFGREEKNQKNPAAIFTRDAEAVSFLAIRQAAGADAPSR
jgi:hypothetical protein